MTLDELEKLADVAGQTVVSSKEHIEYFKMLKPATIKQLVALCRMQHEAVTSVAQQFYHRKSDEAQAAFEKFEKGEGS